jgi:hypothetical protein
MLPVEPMDPKVARTDGHETHRLRSMNVSDDVRNCNRPNGYQNPSFDGALAIMLESAGDLRQICLIERITY